MSHFFNYGRHPRLHFETPPDDFRIFLQTLKPIFVPFLGVFQQAKTSDKTAKFFQTPLDVRHGMWYT